MIHDAVDLAAARTSSNLFDWVKDASEYPVLADPAWREARKSAAAAALAMGAPDLLRDNETDVLTARWRRSAQTHS